MMAQDNEASVEEILESIKKVIARDNRAGALEARRRRMLVPGEDDAAPASEPDPASSAHVVRDAPDAAAEQDHEVLDLADMECMSESRAEGRAETRAEPSAVPMAQTEDSPLIADALRETMQENLAALAMMAQPPARPQIVRSGETSLEGLTRELLRPMLAEWLEANLPAMVEQLVQAEIARIVGKRR